MKALILNPHDDDGIIGMGGTIIQLINEQWEIGYIQFTDGRHGSQLMSPEQTKTIRAKETETERKFLGVNFFYTFDIEDGALNKLSKKQQEKITNKLVRTIDKYKPNIVFMPGPAEGHPDHRAAYQFGHAAIRNSRTNPLEVHYLVWLFPFCKQDPGKPEKLLFVPIDNQIDKKLAAIKIHASQEAEGRYSQIVHHINHYLALLYSTYWKQLYKAAEVLAIPKINSNYKIFTSTLEKYEDVTKVLHGRKEEKIDASGLMS